MSRSPRLGTPLGRVWAAALTLVAAGHAPHGARGAEPNRNLLPIGERESAMANAGITSPTGAAAFYNPANLTRVEHPSISMSGTTLMSFHLETDAILVVEGQGVPFEAGGFLTIPTSLISTYRWGDWSLATAVLVPNAMELSDRSSFELGALSVTTLQSIRWQELWLGGSVARPIAERTSVGLSVFGVQRDESSFSLTRIGSPLAPGSVLENGLSSSARVRGLTAVMGLQHRWSEQTGFGVRLQLPLWRLSGQADLYDSSVGSGEFDGAEIVDRREVAYHSPLPWDVGVGITHQPHAALELVFDVNLQLPASVRQDLEEGREQEFDAALRLSAALEWAATSDVMLQLGLSFNGSAQPDLEQPGDVREDYLGATAGVAWTSGRTRTGLGFFVLRSIGDMRPSGDPDAPLADVSSRLMGALLSFAYNL